jgi:hypothetical protein
MEGGFYNRVISVKVDDTKKNAARFYRRARRFLCIFAICAGTDRKSQTKEYVIRMPRYEQAWTEYEIAILLFLSKRNVPVPTIQSFSLSPTNTLGTRYSIQPRLPGKNLDDGVYVDLTTSQASLSHAASEPHSNNSAQSLRHVPALLIPPVYSTIHPPPTSASCAYNVPLTTRYAHSPLNPSRPQRP